MIIRASTVVELPAGTVVNVASTTANLRLQGSVLARLSSDETYASLGEPAGGFLHGAYMDLLVDAQGKSEDGTLVSLPRGSSLFVVPGTLVAVVAKAAVAQKEGCSRLGWAIGAAIFGVIIGAAIGASTR